MHYNLSLLFTLLTIALSYTAGLASPNSAIIDSLKLRLKEKLSDTTRVDVLGDLAYHYSRINLDSADHYVKLSLILSEKIDDAGGRLNYLYQSGLIEKNRGNNHMAYDFFSDYLEQAEENRDSFKIVSVLFQLAVLDYNLSNYSDAIHKHHSAIRIYESWPNMKHKSSLHYNSLGLIYNKIDQHDAAETSFNKAKEMNKAKDNSAGIAANAINLGNLYAKLEHYDDALKEYEEALYHDSITNYVWGLGFDYEAIGNILVKQGKYNQGLDYLEKSLQIRKEMKTQYEIASSYRSLGKLYFAKGQYYKAGALFQQSLEIAQKTSNLDLIKEMKGLLSDNFAKQNNYQKAYALKNEYALMSDTLLGSRITNQIAEMETKYNTAKKEKEIALLNAENKITALRLTSSKNLSYALAGISLILLGFLYSLYQLNLKIRRQKLQIGQALSEKETLLKEIHHRVKNNLQVVSSLLYLQGRSVTDNAAAAALQEGQNRVKSMSLIHQKLYQEENLTSIDVKDYFEKLIPSIFNSYNISPERIKLSLNIAPMRLDVDTLIPVGLIVNELITNALKHGFSTQNEGVINVELREKSDQLYLRVADNGVGMTGKKIGQLKESFGYELVQSFSDQLDADINIKGDSGTSIEVSIKDYKIAS